MSGAGSGQATPAMAATHSTTCSTIAGGGLRTDPPGTNVVWCTGFHPGFSWIDLPVLGPQEPRHRRGIVESEPGLYFIGLKFLYSVSSEQIHGVGRDADYIAGKISAGCVGRINRQTIHRREREAHQI
ncbi:MAG TPA: hypothetical protein VKB32_07970 [Actinomycetota bacterium]|nr:hypothetical protein [Actinomycetota bacterium]